MSNAVYPKTKEAGMNGGLGLPAATVKCVMVQTPTYTYSAAHEFLSDVPVGARVSTSGALTTKTITNGQFDADNPTFTAVPAGDPIEAIIAYIDTGVEGTSRLLCYIDSSTGLPVTPNGTDITPVINSYLFSF